MKNSQKFYSLYSARNQTNWKIRIMGVFKEDTLEYVDYQKKIRQIIENLTEEKSKKIGISRRGFFYLKRKLESTDKPLRLKEKILIRLNNFI